MKSKKPVDQRTLNEKVAASIDRLQSFCPPEGYYLAFSGGKDSVVLYRLAEMAGVKFDAHFNLTSVDPPEVIAFTKKYFPAVSLDKPEKSMWKLIEAHLILPLRRTRFCCEHLKERGGTGRCVLTGVRWQESAARSSRRMIESCMRDPSKRYVHPIIDWKSADIWGFIRAENVPYCCLYDEGFKRIGCIGCPNAGKQVLRQFERWPVYRRLYLAAAAAVVRRKRERPHLKQYASGRVLFNHWLEMVTGVAQEDLIEDSSGQLLMHFDD